MTRILLAGLLVLASLATLSVPHAQAVCRVDYRYVEDAGATVTCREPNTDLECYVRGPGYWDPVPTVRCLDLVDFPPEMPVLCHVTVVPIGASYPDVEAACTTEHYVGPPAPVCRTWVDTTAPQDTSAGCA